jgi:hypothetical protein
MSDGVANPVPLFKAIKTTAEVAAIEMIVVPG